MPKHISTNSFKRILATYGVEYVKKNHPEAVNYFKQKNTWEEKKEKYAE